MDVAVLVQLNSRKPESNKGSSEIMAVTGEPSPASFGCFVSTHSTYCTEGLGYVQKPGDSLPLVS